MLCEESQKQPNAQKDRSVSRFASLQRLPHSWLLAVALLIALIWSSVLFSIVYPYPSRWNSDDQQYLLVAQGAALSGQPYMNISSEVYGGDIHDMVALNKPYPQYRYVLGYHFPSYSYLLALPLVILGNSFWAVCLTHTLLFLGIVALTYFFTLYLTSFKGQKRKKPPKRHPSKTEDEAQDRVAASSASIKNTPSNRPNYERWKSGNKVAAFITAIAVALSPTLSLYLPITMPEVFLVFFTMLAVFLALRPSNPKNDLVLALVLSILLMTRLTYLLLVIAVFAHRLFRADRTKAYWSLPLLLLPLLAVFTLGRNGFLRSSPNMWQASGFSSNVELLVNYRFAWSGHAMHELLLYLGIVVLLISYFRFFHVRFFRIVAFSHLGILALVFLFYTWWEWRHIRVGMWFVPFAYVLLVSSLVSIRTRRIQIACILLACVLLVPITLNLNRILLFDTLPSERVSAHNAYLYGQRLKAYADQYYPEAEFVLVPYEARPVALIDSRRTYYSSWPKHIDESLPFLRESDLLPDLAFVENTEFHRLQAAGIGTVSWDEVYRLEESPFEGITVLVRRQIG